MVPRVDEKTRNILYVIISLLFGAVLPVFYLVKINIQIGACCIFNGVVFYEIWASERRS